MTILKTIVVPILFTLLGTLSFLAGLGERKDDDRRALLLGLSIVIFILLVVVVV